MADEKKQDAKVEQEAQKPGTAVNTGNGLDFQAETEMVFLNEEDPADFSAETRKALKKDGLLTSDSRVKERKKYGLAGARKRFQFSKR